MKHRRRLFHTKDIYNLPPTDNVFVNAMKENLAFHMQRCGEYRDMLAHFGYDGADALRDIDDLSGIPPLPASYLKNRTMLSKPYESLLIKTTSSGTSASGGNKTLSGFDVGSALCGLSMILKVFKHHRLISLRRTNYIILGYQPNKTNQTAMAKALKGFTLFAPAKSITYALEAHGDDYKVNEEGVINAVLAYGKQRNPVRIIGFPAYFKMLVDELDKREIRLKLHPASKVLLGGGWKSFFSDEISKDELFELAHRVLGIRLQNFKDHFSTAEHPINYIACENHNFHVPVFSRVIIRDVNTLAPVPYGVPGLLNLISPLLTSAPYGSILTDDIAVMRCGGKCDNADGECDNAGGECGCGIMSPYFTIIGRVGLASIKTCTQVASEYLKSI